MSGATSSRPTNAVRQALLGSLSPRLAAEGFDLEDVSVTKAGARSVVRVVVDRDGGVDLDAVADASRLVSEALDEGDGPMPGAYVLEVTSPGVDRPLTESRHWRRAVGRLVAVRTRDGQRIVARLTDADETTAEIVPQPSASGGGRGKRGAGAGTASLAARRLAYADVAHAVVEIEFSRADPDAAADHAAEDDAAEDDAAEDDAAEDDAAEDDDNDDVEGTEQ